MTRFICAILLSWAHSLFPAPQTPTRSEPPLAVSLSLPESLPSETVQTSYFLTGPFGGYGGFAPQRTGAHAVVIPAEVEGKPGSEIKMIVYASGCEIQKFDILLKADSKLEQDFHCDPISTAKLAGQIVPNELVKNNHAELVVNYMAYWANDFYGITDGMVPEFRVATVCPDASGIFQVNLPNFSSDSADPASRRSASFRLILRHSITWNSIASNLEPELPEFKFENHSLRIRTEYPEGLRFTAGNW